MRGRRWLWVVGGLVLLAAALALLLSTGLIPRLFGRSPSSSNVRGVPPGSRRVLVIGLDGCSFDLVHRWIAEGKLPHLAALLSESASGYLSSIEVPRVPGSRPTISSPVVWTTLATGKLPDQHGVWDFGEPFPDTLYAWMGERGQIVLPPSPKTAMEISLDLKPQKGIDQIPVQFLLNGTLVRDATVPSTPAELRLVIKAEQLRLDRNSLELRAAGSVPQPRRLGCRSVTMRGEDGALLTRLDPWRNPAAFAEGWEMPDTSSSPMIQTAHRRVRAIWDMLSERGYSVGIVGWWGTWPAYKVNGELLSSYLGLRGRKQLGEETSKQNLLARLPHLCYPDSYARHILEAGLIPTDSAREFAARILDLKACLAEPQGRAHFDVVEDVFAQDNFFSNLTRDILSRSEKRDLVTVYFEGSDTVGHKFLGPATRRGGGRDKRPCLTPEEFEVGVEHYYSFLDEKIGALVDVGGTAYDTLMIVTDHGFDERGHANNGWILLRGPGIRRTVLRTASVRDVTPTLLYLFGLPIGEDMDGEPLLRAFTPDFRTRNPVRTVATYETTPVSFEQGVSTVDKELEERFRALGYIE